MKSVLNNRIFKSLIAEVECITGDDLDVIGFTSEFGKYSLSFQDIQGELVVEECVREIKEEGKVSFIEIFLSKEQKNKLSRIAQTTADNIISRIKEEDYNERLEYDHRNWLHSACGSSMF